MHFAPNSVQICLDRAVLHWFFTIRIVRRDDWTVINPEAIDYTNAIGAIEFPANLDRRRTNSVYPDGLHLANHFVVDDCTRRPHHAATRLLGIRRNGELVNFFRLGYRDVEYSSVLRYVNPLEIALRGSTFYFSS